MTPAAAAAFAAYRAEAARVRASGRATEHSYRAALQTLVGALAPELGADTDAVLRELGLPDSEIAALRADGVIGGGKGIDA